MKSGRAVLPLALWICAAGCANGDASIDAVATDSVAAAMNAEIRPDTTAQAKRSSADPFNLFTVEVRADVATTIVTTPVWLINDSSRPLIVTANGGAESVVVDTLAAADSVLVSIDTRARSIDLSARTLEGRPGPTIKLSMDSETKRAAFPR